MFVLFFGGISLHLGTAIVCHFLSINMEWTATAKELETTGFRVGLDKIFKDFKYMYLVIVPIIGGELLFFLSSPFSIPGGRKVILSYPNLDYGHSGMFIDLNTR